MPLVIQEVLPRSLAAQSGIQAGDRLLTINGNDIRDFIDLQFYGSDCILECDLETEAGEPKQVEIVRRDRMTLGIEPETYKFDSCLNNCIFCFIDQMPSTMRDTLYMKDDDYLYSFVFGNYISLTNLREQDFTRITEQKLSPLYISVHTTNAALRSKMMNYSDNINILDQLRRLSEAGIQLHCQLVLVPDWNDKDELKHSLEDLIQPDLNVSSIGVVPVGLTRYRECLSSLRPFTPEEAARTLEIVGQVRAKHHTDKIFCADEFYVMAQKPLPDSDYYKDFPQVENGIGMIRVMLENWRDKRRNFLREIRKKNKSLLLVTGMSAADSVRLIAEEITRKADCCPATVQPVRNIFMGETVTVSGLLCFNDIKDQVTPKDNEIVVLPGNIFNHDGITLDGYSQLDIKEYWQRDILIVDPLFEDWEWI